MAFDIEIEQGPRGHQLYVPIGAICPGIVVLHGSEGSRAGWSQWVALLMAGSGFCTIAPGYSRGGDAWHAGDILDVDLDQTESMLIWMRESGITSGQVGLYGTSRGAEHALLVTSLMARDGSIGLPDAAAVHAPSDTIVGAFSARKVRTGILLPLKPTERAWRWRGESDALAPGSQIEIERYDGPLFISHGEQDAVWGADRTQRLAKRLRAAGRRPEVHIYKGEGHVLLPEAQNTHYLRVVDFFGRALIDGSL